MQKQKKPVVINLKKSVNGYTVVPEDDESTVFVLKRDKIIQKKKPDLEEESESPKKVKKDNEKEKEKEEKKDKKLEEEEKEKKLPKNLPPELRFKESLKKQTSMVLPSSSIWFDINKVHKIEKESLPEFFQMSNFKTEERYKNLRNTILAIFYQNSDCYLTATNCLQMIGGDCCSIIRVHHFLEHWGLINFFFDVETQDTDNCTALETENFNVNKTDPKLDLFHYYEQMLKNQYESVPLHEEDLLTKICQDGGTVCDYCGKNNGVVWYEEKIRKKNVKQEKDKKEDNIFKLCVECYKKNNFPCLYIKTDFQKTFMLNKIRDQKEREWTLEKKIKVFKFLKETNFNLKRMKEFFPEDSDLEIIKNILKIPFQDFKNFNKLSSKNFEMIFKKNEKKSFSIFDNLENDPIIKKMAFLRLILDKELIEKDEKMNESYILHEQNVLQENIINQNKFPINSLLENLIKKNKNEIVFVKNQLEENSDYLIKKLEKKMLKQIQEINYRKFQRLKRKLEFMEEYEKYLLYKEKVLKIKEDDILVKTFLKKRNQVEFEY